MATTTEPLSIVIPELELDELELLEELLEELELLLEELELLLELEAGAPPQEVRTTVSIPNATLYLYLSRRRRDTLPIIAFSNNQKPASKRGIAHKNKGIK
jgi:hypothetical protein